MKVNGVTLACTSLVGITTLSFAILSSNSVLADTSVTSTATVTIAESCTMSGTTDTAHTANLVNGTYSGTDYANGIGQTTLKAFCNDSAGFAIYAIGYTNNEYGNTYLHWNKATSDSDHTADIQTGIYTSGSTTNSTWSMKLAALTGTYAATIDDGNSSHNNSTEDFTNWHEVPDEYERVAYRTTGTDTNNDNNGTGSSITVTYDAYVSTAQPAGSYTGQVKFTMVHPSTAAEPEIPLEEIIPNNTIVYAPNASDIVGNMSSLPQTTFEITAASPQAGAISAVANSTIELIAPNFKRAGYGFAGWSTDFEATSSSIIYGPNETISTNPQDARGLDVSGGAVLYPAWIAKETNVTMQTFNSTNYSAYNSAPNGTVIALEDERDHDVYAVAKLADGKWWMIENLRLDDSATITVDNTHNPLHDINNNNIVTLKIDYTNDTIANHLAVSNDNWCPSSVTSSCIDETKINTNNTNMIVGATNSTGVTLEDKYYNNINRDGSNNKIRWYGYGNYYNWYSATAGNGPYSTTTNNTTVVGDLCPAGWHLPKGGDKNNTANSDYWALGIAIIGAQPANASSQTKPYYTGATEGVAASKAFRVYPNNFVLSGGWSNTTVHGTSENGLYWSSTAGGNSVYILAFYSGSISNNVYPGTITDFIYRGNPVRCVAGS